MIYTSRLEQVFRQRTSVCMRVLKNKIDFRWYNDSDCIYIYNFHITVKMKHNIGSCSFLPFFVSSTVKYLHWNSVSFLVMEDV